MAELVYLNADEEMPDEGDDMRWLRVSANTDGSFSGFGGSWKKSGEWVGYIALPEDRVDLPSALQATQEWAERYDVPTIWVELTPS